MTQPLTYKNLTTAQIEAIRAILEKYKAKDVTDAEIEAWVEFATGDTLGSRLEKISNWYKRGGDKSVYLKAMEILKLFHPEIDSPLFKLMREMENDL